MDAPDYPRAAPFDSGPVDALTLRSLRLSEKKLAANRANAAKSTGPRSAEGKRAAAMNAVSHGLTARTPLLPGEDTAAFEAFVASVVRSLRPEGGLQEELALEVAAASWKLRRVGEAERVLMDDHVAKEPGSASRALAHMLRQSSTWDSSPNSHVWRAPTATRPTCSAAAAKPSAPSWPSRSATASGGAKTRLKANRKGSAGDR